VAMEDRMRSGVGTAIRILGLGTGDQGSGIGKRDRGCVARGCDAADDVAPGHR